MLLDVNVLLALAFEAHAHHEAAKAWFADVEACVVCRMTQSAFLRLASNPALFGEEALTLSEAWGCWDALMEDERIGYRLEPLGIEQLWRKLTMSNSYSPKVWNDRYLAAFALADSLTLVTFDKAFAAVPDLDVRILTGG